jgi:hypothetical protein
LPTRAAISASNVDARLPVFTALFIAHREKPTRPTKMEIL